MKKSATVLAAIAVTFSVLAARATEYTYSELFENGKIWNVVDEYYDYINDETTTECLQVSVGDESKDGDHLLRELNYRNLESGFSSSFLRLEEDRTIYAKDSQTYRRLIDFNLGKGDLVPVEDGEDGMAGHVIGYYYVVNDEIIDIKGTERRVLSIGSEMDGSPFTYWIEGIGSIHDWIMLLYPVPTCSPYLLSRHIESCYLNGKCIFSLEEFEEYMLRSGIVPNELSDIGKGFISLKGNVLEVNSHSENITVNVYSFDGNLYISENITYARTVSISTLPSGFYYARASFPDGSSSYLKFIKR